ncbi:MAG: restriction endonuclease [Candidatus Eremiobacteraeota bacterium]|nr:restriction endonuclease [Candidatus Eremiobacteraeota bacterium]
MYDFTSLSSYDFEILVRDLLQKEKGITLESFKSGRDKGIDLRYSRKKRSRMIIQCKHYAVSGFSPLYRNLEKTELAKVKELGPSKYLLATSVGLTPSNKDKILQLFHPYIKLPNDIYGKEDLNNLLGKFPKIETKNFKLWLSSTAVLSKLLNSAICNQTEFELEKIKNKIRIYVQNNSFLEAREMLDENYYCIIAGTPGIGKTTLAEMLIYDYASHNYEPIVVTSDISEAYQMFCPQKKQVFYYDDFLGQTSLCDKLGKNEDRRIINFIEKIQNSKTKRFILTTREYILNRARYTYEPFSRYRFQECVINLSNYTKFDKAKILYNHVYFSDLPEGCKFELCADQSYRKIINHKNYSPRIVEWMTLLFNEEGFGKGHYVETFLQNLDNPSKIWEIAFKHQISDSSRFLLIVLSTLPSPIHMEHLSAAFQSYCRIKSEHLSITFDPQDLKYPISELFGNFIITQRSPKGDEVKFHNPSIRDFLDNYIRNNPAEIINLSKGSIFFDQYTQIWKIICPNLPDEFLYCLLNNMLCRSSNGSYIFIWHRFRFILQVLDQGNVRIEFRKDILGRIHPLLLNYLSIKCDLFDGFASSIKLFEKHCLDCGVSGNEILLESKKYILNKLDNIHELYYLNFFEEFLDFHQSFPLIIDKRKFEEARDIFTEENEGDLDWHQNDCCDPEEIESYVYSVESVASGFDIDISSEIDSLNERIRSLEEENFEPEDEDDWDYDHQGESRANIKFEIDSLFQSLVDHS